MFACSALLHCVAGVSSTYSVFFLPLLIFLLHSTLYYHSSINSSYSALRRTLTSYSGFLLRHRFYSSLYALLRRLRLRVCGVSSSSDQRLRRLYRHSDYDDTGCNKDTETYNDVGQTRDYLSTNLALEVDCIQVTTSITITASQGPMTTGHPLHISSSTFNFGPKPIV